MRTRARARAFPFPKGTRMILPRVNWIFHAREFNFSDRRCRTRVSSFSCSSFLRFEILNPLYNLSGQVTDFLRRSTSSAWEFSHSTSSPTRRLAFRLAYFSRPKVLSISRSTYLRMSLFHELFKAALVRSRDARRCTKINRLPSGN